MFIFTFLISRFHHLLGFYFCIHETTEFVVQLYLPSKTGRNGTVLEKLVWKWISVILICPFVVMYDLISPYVMYDLQLPTPPSFHFLFSSIGIQIRVFRKERMQKDLHLARIGEIIYNWKFWSWLFKKIHISSPILMQINFSGWKCAAIFLFNFMISII